jgi:hypothetical protein
MFKHSYKTGITTLLLVLWLITSCNNPKYFTGIIEYQYTYESSVLNEDSLAKIKPFKSAFQYDNNNYQSRFFALDTTTYYYSGQLGKCISQINSANKFECEDYSISTDSVLSYKEYDSNEKVLGQKCKIIEWQGTYFYNVFYVSIEKQIAPNTYKNHVAYKWKFYGEKAKGGLILKSEHRFKNYTMKGIAVSIKEEKHGFKSLNIDMVNFERICK